MFRHRRKTRSGRGRRGLTLAELLVATTVVTIIVGGLGALAQTVETGNTYSNGRATATQHARVAIDRIERALHDAHVSPAFSGFLVISQQISPYTYPDTLVVWKPTGQPANPTGLPLRSELVIYRPNSSNPHQLLEITVRGDTTVVPAPSDQASWYSFLQTLPTSSYYEAVAITDLLRTAQPTSSGNSGAARGAVRFQAVLRPSDADWNAYKSGSVAWESLPWVQDIQGSQAGLRQAWCSFEIQLMPGPESFLRDPRGDSAMAFFGSAARYYELHK